MYILYRKKNNKVVSISKEPVENSGNLLCAPLEISLGDYKKIMTNNFDVYYKNGIIELILNEKGKYIEKHKRIKDKIAKVKSDNYTGEDIISLINELL